MSKWKDFNGKIKENVIVQLYVSETLDSAKDEYGQILEDVTVEYATSGFYSEKDNAFSLFLPIQPEDNIDDIGAEGWSEVKSNSVLAQNRNLKILKWKKISDI